MQADSDQSRETDHRPDASALAGAAQVIDALNDVLAHDGPPVDKAKRLLRSFQALIGHDADVEMVLQTDITRDPAPRVVERVCVGPTFDRIEPRPDSEVQALLDASAPAVRRIIPNVLQRLRSPHAYIVSRDIPDPEWFDGFRERFLRPHGWEDLIVSDWATGEQQMVGLAVLRRAEMPPLDERARQVTSLMLRAVAPIVIRGMFDGGDGEDPMAILADRDLSGRQTDVLHLLLRGMSEKEAARELSVSTHTIHTHVKKLYTEFGVSSRGELLAIFVDARVVRQTA